MYALRTLLLFSNYKVVWAYLWLSGKIPPAKQEMWVQSLGREDSLEKEMATHSSILAWEIPWKEEPGKLYSPWGCKELDMTEQLKNNNSKVI